MAEKKQKSELSFEEALKRLEESIAKLESGDLPLEKSLAIFEEGISLLRTCDMHLKSARGRIAELLKTESGDYVEKILGTTLESFVEEGSDERA